LALVLGEFHVLIETADLVYLDAVLRRLGQRPTWKRCNHALARSVNDAIFASRRDFPDLASQDRRGAYWAAV
jgi:hypothetical protein